jgi:hypothetical protein
MKKNIKTRLTSYRVIEHIITLAEKRSYGIWEVKSDSAESAFYYWANYEVPVSNCLMKDKITFRKIKKNYFEVLAWFDFSIEKEQCTFRIRKVT